MILARKNIGSRRCSNEVRSKSYEISKRLIMKKFYITTAIAYTNGAPHIGHTLEFIQTDALARYRRQQGDEVFFLTGTDEHGTKIMQTAELQGKEPQKFADEISKQFKDLKKTLDLSWDAFIRTTDKDMHWPGVYEMYDRAKKNGDIEKRTYKGLYCVGCEAFVTEKELVDGKCPIHQKEPEAVEEENYFFLLSKYGKEIERKIKSNEIHVVPESKKSEILSFLSEGLRDISISRPKDKMAWGITLPDDDTQVFYVWFDALTNYISAVGLGREDEKSKELLAKWWPADVHVIGKDIIRFHATIWIGMLMSANLSLPKTIMAHGFITSGGQKMSKSLGNVISPTEQIEKYGTDPVRYFLLREIPTTDDGDYTEQKFRDRYNGELANGLGNFSARVLTLASQEDFVLLEEEYGAMVEDSVKHRIKDAERTIREKMDAFRLHEAVGTIWEVITFGDLYVNEMKPWKQEGEEKKKTMANLLFILESITRLLEPFLPKTAETIAKNIRHEGKKMEITKGENLFPRL